jgi:deazaflavin-dependent oxidoreductase (nitroreductase family)
MNKILNPLVCMILSSPLHGMMSATLLLITYKGRKSGKEYSLPVQYVQDNRTIYIVVGMPEKKTWWRNLRYGAKVKLWLTGNNVIGDAIVLEGEDEAESIAKALNLYLRRFPPAAKKHGIRLGNDGSFNQDDIRREASSTILVRVNLSK